MTTQGRTLVVVPALNESATLARVITEIAEQHPLRDCLVVDDGSTDGTAAVARAAGARVATLPFNIGVGGAMRLGFRIAQREGYRNVVQVDADGQHDPAHLPELIDALQSADLVIGARFAGAGSYIVHGPRRWAMSLLSRVLSRAAHTVLSDTTSGFKACGPRALDLFAQDYPAEYLGDTVEALVIAIRAGCRIVQVPVAMRARMGGEPSHNPTRAAVYLGRAAMALIVAFTRPRGVSS